MQSHLNNVKKLNDIFSKEISPLCEQIQMLTLPLCDNEGKDNDENTNNDTIDPDYKKLVTELTELHQMHSDLEQFEKNEDKKYMEYLYKYNKTHPDVSQFEFEMSYARLVYKIHTVKSSYELFKNNHNNINKSSEKDE